MIHFFNRIFRNDALKICAIRETVEETGMWPFNGNVKNFNEIKNDFNSFLLCNNIKIESIIQERLHAWMCWRTPDCKSIYPQQWDLQMFVSKTDHVSVNNNFYCDETVEVNWFEVKDILYLASPQWYMMKQWKKK